MPRPAAAASHPVRASRSERRGRLEQIGHARLTFGVRAGSGDAGIEQRVEQVDDQIDHDEGRRGEHDDRLHDRDVLRQHGLLGEPAEPLRENTVSTTIDPVTVAPTSRPRIVSVGSAALRNACRTCTAKRLRPFARAVAMYGSSSVSSKLRISTWASTAAVGIAIVIAGSTRLCHPSLPMAGNQPSVNANTWISSSPIQKFGTLTPDRREPAEQVGERPRGSHVGEERDA